MRNIKLVINQQIFNIMVHPTSQQINRQAQSMMPSHTHLPLQPLHPPNLNPSIHQHPIAKPIPAIRHSSPHQPQPNSNNSLFKAPCLDSVIIQSQELLRKKSKQKNNLQSQIESITMWHPKSLDLTRNSKQGTNFANYFFQEVKTNTEKQNIYQPSKLHGQINHQQRGQHTKKNRAKDPMKVGQLQVESLIDMVDGMYEKAIDTKIKVQVGIAFEQKRQKFCSQKQKMRANWSKSNEQMKELTNTGINVSGLNQNPRKISSMVNFYGNLDSFQIPVIDDDRQCERVLSKTQRVSLETLPQDHDYENQSKQEENEFESKISQTFSDIKVAQSPISSNISSSWIKSGLQFFHSEQKQKQTDSNCNCNENQNNHEKEKARSTFLTNKYNEILSKKENQKHRNESTIEKSEFNKQMRERQSSTRKSFSFLQQKTFHSEEKAILKQPKQKQIFHLNQQVQHQRNPSPIIQPLKQTEKAQSTKKSSEKQQKGVYESVLSNYSTAMLISFYKENDKQKNKPDSSKEKVRTKSLSLKKNKVEPDILMPVVSCVAKQKIRKVKF